MTGLLRAFWLWWGLIVVGMTGASMLRLALSAKARKRAVAGGRSPAGFLILLPGALTAILLGTWAKKLPLVAVVLAFFVPLLAYAQVRRRRLATVPSEQLSPMIRAQFERTPDLGELTRHPIAATKRNIAFIADLAALRRAEREWEREQSLR